MSRRQNTMMSRRWAGGGADSNIIYQLYNHTCDGTAATAINTGIYLFDSTLYPDGWDLVLDFTVGSGNGGNASFVRCRNQATPYKGFMLRRNGDNANTLSSQVNSQKNKISKTTLSGTRFTVTVEWPNSSNKCELKVDGGNAISDSMSGAVSPLVIGGELSDDTTQVWNPDRFSNITIHSLIITAKE